MRDIRGFPLVRYQRRVCLGGDLGGINREEPPGRGPQGDACQTAGLVVARDLDGHDDRAGPSHTGEILALGVGVDAQPFAEGGEENGVIPFLWVSPGGGEQDAPLERDGDEGNGKGRSRGGVRPASRGGDQWCRRRVALGAAAHV